MEAGLNFLIAYVAAALAMLVLDAAWLSAMVNRLYRPHLGDLLMDGFRGAPAAVFYFLYVAGVVVLAVLPALETDKWTMALARGMVLGLVAYGTYNLTNQATLRHWSTVVTLADMSWGTVLTGAAAVAGYFVVRSLS